AAARWRRRCRCLHPSPLPSSSWVPSYQPGGADVPPPRRPANLSPRRERRGAGAGRGAPRRPGPEARPRGAQDADHRSRRRPRECRVIYPRLYCFRGLCPLASEVVFMPRPAVGRRRVNRVATISVHTSPLDQPGTGDAGGMNVYIVEVAKRLAEMGVETEIFTRRTARDLPPVVELAPGVLVRHVTAGPYEELDKEDLSGQLCAFAGGVLRTEAAFEPGRYDVIHSHYWLSGQVGWLAKERWGVPLVHTMHTMAK